MSAKHTPGRWETLTYANHELQTNFAMVKIGGRVHMVGCTDDDKANARLIAAAPELLNALQVMLDAAQHDITQECDIARAAIAKAIG